MLSGRQATCKNLTSKWQAKWQISLSASLCARVCVSAYVPNISLSFKCLSLRIVVQSNFCIRVANCCVETASHSPLERSARKERVRKESTQLDRLGGTYKMDAASKLAGEIVVLTGASGCLGRATLKLLISRDERVQEIRCLDLVEPDESMRAEVEDEIRKSANSFAHKKQVQFVRGDIRDINCVERVLYGADCVLHCAAKVDIWTESSNQNASELESINVNGTETLLKASIRFGVSRFVHVSSFESFVNYHTIYYATEATIPEPSVLMFGQSGWTKREAEFKVKQYSNNKLQSLNQTNRNNKLEIPKDSSCNGDDALNAVILRFPTIYGEHDKHYISKLLQVTNKFFGGRLQRFTNVWIRQQPIYVGNAAWALVRAKQQMEHDNSISGEEFHITDDTLIGDPFDFAAPFVSCKGMRMSNNTLPAIPVWLMLLVFSWLRGVFSALDLFGLFTTKKSRLDEQIEQDSLKLANKCDIADTNLAERLSTNNKREKWYDVVTPQIFYFFCNSLFLNRTKASLRLDYEPIYKPDEALERSLSWYKNHLTI